MRSGDRVAVDSRNSSTLKAGKVVRQHAAVAVENSPARRDDGKVADAVAFSQIQILLVLSNLQPPISHQ